MTWFIASIISQFISGTAVVFDKLIYQKHRRNIFSYVFWLGVFGLVSLLFIPFGAQINVSSNTLLLSFLAGTIFLAGMFFFFRAVFEGETSNEAVLIAAVSSVVTLLISSLVIGDKLDSLSLLAFFFLISGGFILFFVEKKKIRLHVYKNALLSALFFGISYVLSKMVFIEVDFFTGFMWIKIGGFLGSLLMLLVPYFYREILKGGKQKGIKSLAYLANRFYAGVGSALVYYATSIGPVALVNALENLRFVFIFLGGWLILRERFKGWVLLGKISSLIVISLGMIILGALQYFASTSPDFNRKINLGVTFSAKYAKAIDLNWKEAFEAMIIELKPKNIRLIAYWDLIEKEDDRYDFEELDYQINMAEDSGAKIILAIGQKTPRWPECHIPNWAHYLPNDERERELLEYLAEVTLRYRENEAINYFQVENEPFLVFGECPPISESLIDKEVSLVKSLAQNKFILMTDGGEFGAWQKAFSKSDIFGTTMYRKVHSDRLGYFDYNLPPEFFRIKESIIRFLNKDKSKKIIVIELATEPWLIEYPTRTSVDEQMERFSLDFFADSIRYAKLTGYEDYYLWGVEWWYWMKEIQKQPQYWDFAQKLFLEAN